MVNSNAFTAWRLFQLNWIPIAAMGAVTLIAGAFCGFTIEPVGLGTTLAIAAALGLIPYCYAFAKGDQADPKLIFPLGALSQLLLIAVIMSSVVLSAYAHVLTSFPVLGNWIGPAISGFTHYGILTVFFTLLYKWLPTGGVPWRFALVSGAVNSLLFAVGNRALVYYFEVTKLTSAFGATAGFAAIMVWMYWTSLTILVGAQVGRATRDAFEAAEPGPEAAKAHH